VHLATDISLRKQWGEAEDAFAGKPRSYRIALDRELNPVGARLARKQKKRPASKGDGPLSYKRWR
jgi:hypothetical protein